MCLYCEQDEVWGEPLEPDEADEEYQCEWLDETDRDDEDDEDEEDEEDLEQSRCLSRALHAVHQRYVDEHLCAEHADAVRRDLSEGLGDLLAQAGLEDECEFLSIPLGSEVCEYAHPLDMIRPAVEVTECGSPATYAKRVVTTTFLCTPHAVEAGYDPPR
jgi:hypothetical protein